MKEKVILELQDLHAKINNINEKKISELNEIILDLSEQVFCIIHMIEEEATEG